MHKAFVEFRRRTGLSHEASVYEIIFPDYLAIICHYTPCDWLRQLPRTFNTPSRGVALFNTSLLKHKTRCFHFSISDLGALFSDLPLTFSMWSNEIFLQFRDLSDFALWCLRNKCPILRFSRFYVSSSFTLCYLRNTFSTLRFTLFYRLYDFLGTRLKNEVVCNSVF